MIHWHSRLGTLVVVLALIAIAAIGAGIHWDAAADLF